MKFLTDALIRQAEAEIVAQQIADDAARLSARAGAAGFVVEMHSIEDVFSAVSVRPRNIHARAMHTAVQA